MAWTLLLGLLCALPSPAGTIDDIQRLIGELASRVQQAQRVVQVAAGRLATDVRTKTQDQFNKAWAETGLVGDAAANAAALLLKAQQACVKNDSKLMQSLADAAAQTDKLSREATALVVQIPDTTAAITRTANSSLASGSQSLIDNIVNNLVTPLQTFLNDLLTPPQDLLNLDSIMARFNAIDAAIADAPQQLAARLAQDTLAGFAQLDGALGLIQQKRLQAQQILADAASALDKAMKAGCGPGTSASGGGSTSPPGTPEPGGGSTSPPGDPTGGPPASPQPAASPLLFTMPNFEVGDSEVFELDAYQFGYLPGAPRVEGRRTNIGYWLRLGAAVPGPLAICRAFVSAARQAGAQIVYDNQRNWVLARLTRGGIESWGEIACDKDRYRLNLIDRPAPACTQPGCAEGQAPAMVVHEIKSPRDLATGQASDKR